MWQVYTPLFEVWQFQKHRQTHRLGMSEERNIPTRELVCLTWIFKFCQTGSPSVVGEFPSALPKEQHRHLFRNAESLGT